jgi:hypothetical protein
MSGPAIVSTPEGVSEAWLTEVLRHAGALGEAKVIGAVQTRVGDGMLGESVRFDLTYDRSAADAPKSLVGKFPSADPVSRATGAGLGLYLNEVRFYQQIAPTVAIRTPRPFLADIDEATGDFVLVLEDMGPARGGNQLTGCSLADAEVAMDEAAALHGPRWGDPALNDVAFLNRQNDMVAGIGEVFPSIFQAFEARYGDVLEPEHMDACRTFSQNITAFYAGPPAPRTLQHLDFRLDNMLFEPQGGRWPLAVLDWQSVTLGPGVLDVGYFIGAGLTEDLRRKHEKDLLRRWLEALKAYGVKDYGWDQAWDAYRHYLLQGVFTAIFASVGTKQTERGDAMFMTMARRHCAQALDLGSLEMLKR